jgi:hydrogenase maturation protein HypF
VGQHIGDLENLSAYDFFQESIAHFEKILEVRPEILAHDLHPGYLATQWARKQTRMTLVGVQHHHAHIASCMAENHLTETVIGVALDGTGYGTDGEVWGGEILLADFKSFQRGGHFEYVGMPGGERAIHEPWRMAVSYLWSTFGGAWRRHAPSALLAGVAPDKIKFVEQLLESGSPIPQTSSCGRLFDAVAAMALDRASVTYEAQSAIALEACCDVESDHGAYPLAMTDADGLRIDTRPLFVAIAEDLRHDTPPGIMSSRFHAGLVKTLAEATGRIAERTRLRQVCLSGGSFQNAILARGLEAELAARGLEVYRQTQVPPGDGGLSLGQLLIAANSTGQRAT